MEKYDIDMYTLPLYVTVRKDTTPGGIYASYFLDNTSSKPLIVQYKDASQTQLKLVDSKSYNKSSNTSDWYERTDTSNPAGWNSLYNLVRINNKVPSPDTFSSDIKPKTLSPVGFSITAQHNDQTVNITGTLSYTLLKHDCSSTGKIVVADTAVSKATPATIPSVAVSFGQNLSFGMRSVAVYNLQQFLVSQGLLAADLSSGYYGLKTLSAVKAFQRQQNIIPVSGFFGPLTRVKANSVVNSPAY